MIEARSPPPTQDSSPHTAPTEMLSLDSSTRGSAYDSTSTTPARGPHAVATPLSTNHPQQEGGVGSSSAAGGYHDYQNQHQYSEAVPSYVHDPNMDNYVPDQKGFVTAPLPYGGTFFTNGESSGSSGYNGTPAAAAASHYPLDHIPLPNFANPAPAVPSQYAAASAAAATAAGSPPRPQHQQQQQQQHQAYPVPQQQYQQQQQQYQQQQQQAQQAQHAAPAQSNTTLVNPVTILSNSTTNPHQFQAVTTNNTLNLTHNSKPAMIVHSVSNTTSPGQRKRKMLWAGCLFLVVVIAIVLGVTLSKKNEDDHGNSGGSSSGDLSGSRGGRSSTTTSSASVLTPPTGTSVNPPAPTNTTPVAPPFDHLACMHACTDSFNSCIGSCESKHSSCKSGCGGDLSCIVDCGFVQGDCSRPCHTASRECTCRGP